MIWMDFVAALFVALLLSGVFLLLFGWSRPGARGGLFDVIFFFVILFLTTWALGVWMTPVGPVVWGAPWLMFLLVGLVVALLLAATPAGRPRTRAAAVAQAEADQVAATAFGVFFWVLLIILVGAVVARYAW